MGLGGWDLRGGTLQEQNAIGHTRRPVISITAPISLVLSGVFHVRHTCDIAGNPSFFFPHQKDHSPEICSLSYGACVEKHAHPASLRSATVRLTIQYFQKPISR